MSNPSRQAADVGKGRELALLVLCAIESSPAEERADAAELAFEAPAADEGALAQLEALRSNHDARQVARRLVARVIEEGGALDAKIEQASDRWRMARMHQVDRNLLRIAAVELEAGKPKAAVVASEATRLAGLYGAEHSARFVNGVVGTLATRLASGAGADSASTDSSKHSSNRSSNHKEG